MLLLEGKKRITGCLLSIVSRRSPCRYKEWCRSKMPLSLKFIWWQWQNDCKQKSDFMEKLNTLIHPSLIVKEVAEINCVIFDGMAIKQMLKRTPSTLKPTFSDLANLFWSNLLSKSQRISALHVAFDRYLENSIKPERRKKRRPFFNDT